MEEKICVIREISGFILDILPIHVFVLAFLFLILIKINIY